MYIKRIYLKNIRCFKELSLELTCPAEDCRWTMIFGPNGVGKTTILRSIAIGLSDETSASGMLSELTGSMVRHGCKYGEIQIKLSGKNKKETHISKTVIKKGPGGGESIRRHSWEDTKKDFPWNKIFVCGYGAARRSFGSESYENYRLIDSVYTLFNYDASLQNPEVPFSRLEREGVDVGNLFRRIERILNLPEHSIKLDSSGFSVKGPWGTYQPLGAIADGYSATFAWIADLLGWAALFQQTKFQPDFEAIVLLDEIEQHLHPSWQKRIIGELSEQFPNIQFIGTTHAPMCAIAMTALDDDKCDLVTLRQLENYVEGSAGHKPPRHQRADEVLTSYLFGLVTASDDSTKEAIHRYAQLLSKTRNSAEQKEFQKLKDSIDEKVGTAETPFEQEVKEAVWQSLKRTHEKQSAKPLPQQELVDLEIIKQLRALVGDDRNKSNKGLSGPSVQ